MNFLAHCFLSCRDDHKLIGNFLGDFLTLDEVRNLPESIREGVYLHRLIDSYTDQHARVKDGKRLLYPKFHKYAPVVLDIFFDYLFSRNWETFSGESLEHFRNRTYQSILNRLDWVPPRLHPRLRNMVAGCFLHEYASWEGMGRTFSRIQGYISYPALLDDPLPVLKEQEEKLNEVFLDFFPDLILEVNSFCEV